MTITKKLLCLLMTVVIAAASMLCFGVPTAAVSTLDTVELTGIVEPQIGAHPAVAGITVPIGRHYTFTNTSKQECDNFEKGYASQIWFDVDEWKWLDKSSSFQVGHTYRLQLSVLPDSGYAFAEPKDMRFYAGNLTSCVQKVEFFSSGYNDGRSVFSIQFKPLETPKHISSLAITGVPTPIIGQTLSKENIQVSEGFAIQTAVLQTNASGKWAAVTDKVEGDVNYRVYLQLNTVSGYTYADTITATVNGNTTDVNNNPVELRKNSYGYYLYYLLETPQNPSVHIHNYVSERTIDYRSTISFTVDKFGAPEGSHVEWTIMLDSGGAGYSTGDTFTMSNAKEGFTVEARLWGTDGGSHILYGVSEAEHVYVRHGIFDRIKAFFRSLFHRLPVMTQEFLGIEFYE